MTSEHFGGFLVFILLHVAALVYYVKALLPAKTYYVAQALVISAGL